MVYPGGLCLLINYDHVVQNFVVKSICSQSAIYLLNCDDYPSYILVQKPPPCRMSHQDGTQRMLREGFLLRTSRVEGCFLKVPPTSTDSSDIYHHWRTAGSLLELWELKSLFNQRNLHPIPIASSR